MSSTWLTHTHGSVSLEDHDEASRQAQRRADKWMIVGAALMGMWAPGLIGFPSLCVEFGGSTKPCAPVCRSGR